MKIIDKRTFLLHFIMGYYSWWYFVEADWGHGVQEIAAIVSMWFMYFALIAFKKEKFKSDYVSIAMYFSMLTHELPYIETLDAFIKTFANSVDTPSRLYFYSQAVVSIFVIISFVVRKKTFFRIFSTVMFVASLTTLTLLHYLQFSVNTKSFVEIRNMQIEQVVSNKLSPQALCSAQLMECSVISDLNKLGEYKILNNHSDVKSRLEGMKSTPFAYFTWSFADSDNKFRLYSLIKSQDKAIVMVDQEITDIHLTRSTKTFMIQYLIFAIIWSCLGTYLISRHQFSNRRIVV